MRAAMRAAMGKVIGIITGAGLLAPSRQPGDNNIEYRFTY
jgi:hypothetical protein